MKKLLNKVCCCCFFFEFSFFLNNKNFSNAQIVASNKQNIHIIRKLLIELREIVDKYLCWGRPLGSTSLWEQHLRTMERICEMTDAIEIIPVCLFEKKINILIFFILFFHSLNLVMENHHGQNCQKN